MNNYDERMKSIEIAIEAKYLIEFYPELANYDKIQHLVTLAKQWIENVKQNREVL